MAKLPAGVEREPKPSPSRYPQANPEGVIIALSASAERHALRRGILEAVYALALGRDCAIGDMVSVTHGGTEHNFMVILRRWIAGAETPVLEITLDHPARPTTVLPR